MQRETPLVADEVYHVYNRGAHKAEVFLDERDYFRFKLLLFLANTEREMHTANLLNKYKGQSFISIFEKEEVGQGLVDVLGYALMPNHFHLILRQKAEEGISRFMKKVSTGYSMYFNKKHEHSGTVFQGPFKSRHVESGDYLRWLFAYVALNPLDLHAPNWKEDGFEALPSDAVSFLTNYAHASFPDIGAGRVRPERVIINFDALKELEEDVPSFDDVKHLVGVVSHFEYTQELRYLGSKKG
ncbi:MAG: transposase [Patescibacteria group bacterium UBA2163]